MDFGGYNLSCLREIVGTELEVVDVSYRGPGATEDVDEAIKARYKTEQGATATLVADLATTGGWPYLPATWTENWPSFGWPKCVVELGEKEVDIDVSQSAGESHTVQRNVTFWNHLMPTVYHRIDVVDTHFIRRADNALVNTWTQTEYIKSFVRPLGENHVGADWWSTYRYQLEEFVNRIKRRKGSGVWVEGADSIAQMESIDRTYEKAGLRVRPRSEFVL